MAKNVKKKQPQDLFSALKTDITKEVSIQTETAKEPDNKTEDDILSADSVENKATKVEEKKEEVEDIKNTESNIDETQNPIIDEDIKDNESNDIPLSAPTKKVKFKKKAQRETKSKQMIFRTTPTRYKMAEKFASKANISMTQLLEMAMDEFLEKYEV